uniref:Uncharacterized protein n=1 Tax=viral metagenome TaxID=1070528 RepID=A0A6C0LL15_9ZZZZ
MSDEESEGYDTSSTTASNTTGTTNQTSKLLNLFELECDLEEMTETMESLTKHFNHIDDHMKTIEKPIIELALEQFRDPNFLESSPFRNETFAVKPPGLPNIDLTKRYPYKDIVQAVRNYIFAEKLVSPTGAISVNRPLSLLFEIPEGETTFLKLLVRLRKVLV